MTRKASLTAINCTACGAGLDVLGGGRVIRHICAYCGSELDAQDDYKVLRQFADMPRPDSPFAIGMQGRLYGVDWTIIGTLGLREDHAGQTWTWVEHQMFSPTHGYAWLVVEEGHTSFSRRQRHSPKPAFMGVGWVESAEQPPTVRLHGQTFRYFQTTESRITFAEGEFTWPPRIGETVTTVSALSERHMLDFTLSGTEREIYRSAFLRADETCAAFGLPADALSPRGVHPLQPYERGPNAGFIKWTALTGALVALVLCLTYAFSPGTRVLEPVGVSERRLPRTIDFEITQTDRLAGIVLTADVSNSWAYVEVELTDPEEVTLFEAGRTVEYYFGRDSEGSWSEGSRTSALYFHPTVPGRYEVTLSAAETGTWSNGRAPRVITVSAYEGYASGVLPGLVALALALVSGFHWARRGWHEKRRWAQGDWSED